MNLTKIIDSDAKDHSVIWKINESTFPNIALDVFQYQVESNPVYAHYINSLGIKKSAIKTVEQIPFLPIQFFKSNEIISGKWRPETVFKSSGTTGERSLNPVYSLADYCDNATHAFRTLMGNLNNYHIVAFLPSYMEQGNSSLIHMVTHFIDQSHSPHAGFYDYTNIEAMIKKIEALKHDRERRTLVWGVSYALLDLAERGPFKWPHCDVLETGGMKGRKKEITREELHGRLTLGLGVDHIFSEYGMTELMSQAYATSKGRFQCPPWMKVLIRDPSDPFSLCAQGKMGGVNIIDLANVHTCCFIETEDLGISYADNTFEITGRLDHADLRGCNLFIQAFGNE